VSMPLRTKLLVGFLLVVAVTGCAITVVGVQFMDSAVRRRARNEVSHDLELATQLYNSRLEKLRTAIAFTAIRPVTVCRALVEGNLQVLAKALSKVKAESRLDVVSITDAGGRVVLRSCNKNTAGDHVSGDDLIAEVLKAEEPLAATHIWTREQMQREGLEPSEAAGMLMAAAAPVFTGTGDLAGVLYGANLLNRECDRSKHPIVDRTRDTIFRGEKAPGVVAILQGDIVVSTSLTDKEGARAMGPLTRNDIGRAVLGEGRRWQGRRLEGGEWYIAAFEPLRDLRGQTVGMIYVGVPERRYTLARRKTALVFAAVTFAGMVVAAAISFALAAGVMRPLRELARGVSQFSSGNLDYRIKVDSRGPLGELAETFNRMGESIKERDERIKKDAQEMMEAKRLATLGQLAAGVAHEINNPLGGITVYAHLLCEDLAAEDPRTGNVSKIINEADRCKKIVKGLLDYSRQTSIQKESADVNSVLDAAVSLVAQQEAFRKIAVKRNLAAELPPVKVDISQIEEVFTNVLLNAAEAMGGKGEISIRTFLSGGGTRLLVKISDTGPGIPHDSLEQIFEPFFTSKEAGHGTGLGLAISYGIVENHGGTILAENNPTGGATFTVELPLEWEETP